MASGTVQIRSCTIQQKRNGGKKTETSEVIKQRHLTAFMPERGTVLQ